MRNLVSFVLVMVEMEDMKGEKIKKGENRNPKKKGAEKRRRNWDELLVVWY